MATQHHTSKSKSSAKGKKAAPAAKKPEVKAKAKPAAKAAAPKAAPKKEHRPEPKVEHKTEARREERPAGAHATGPADFVITRKWNGKAVEAKAGTHIRVELPENALRGMSWQLQKLPHGVHLDEPEVVKADGITQNRVFNFSVEEEGDYLLQFNLARFGGQFADTFRVKVAPKAD